MEPSLVTAPEHLPALAELRQREPIFHRQEFGTSRSDLENTMDLSFWEVGASGRRYSREYILDLVEKRYQSAAQDVWETRDFHCLEIAADSYLLTYTLIQGERVTRPFDHLAANGPGLENLVSPGHASRAR
jgi:hypothetical protein